MILVAALLMALPCQGAPDDLKKEIEKLRAQNRELQERLSQLEDSAVRDAEQIQRLRAAIKQLEASAPSASGPKAPGINRENGPTAVLKGRVIYVEPKFNFVLVDIGRSKKLEKGYKFQIVRTVVDKEKGERLVQLGVAEFEKYMDYDESAKLKVIEGSASDMKDQDEAVAIRAVPPVPEKTEAESPTTAPGPAKDGSFRIVASAGRGRDVTFTTTYGRTSGAKQTDLLFVYKDGTFKTNLRIDSVTPDYSVATLITPVKKPEEMPEAGDQVFTRKQQKTIAGKVALVDERKMRVATDLRQTDGVKPGQKLEVRHQGQKVGSLQVTEVEAWGSWAKLDGDTKLESIQKGDFVEAVDEK